MTARSAAFGPVDLPHGRRLSFDRPLVMGIVNITPDSFSDGGRFLESRAAIAHAESLISDGADIIDLGGESTRPGASPVTLDDELARVLPTVKDLSSRATPLSIDTMKARMAAAAIEAGAHIVNDVWGLQRDREMAGVVAQTGAFVVAMHNRETVDGSLDMVEDVLSFLSRSIDIALRAGIAQNKIAVDPGFGFGKTHEQSLALVRDLERLKTLGCPILLGVSRKRAIGHATGRQDPMERLAGSLACGTIALERGANILRAHDVKDHVDAVSMWSAVMKRESVA